MLLSLDFNSGLFDLQIWVPSLTQAASTVPTSGREVIINVQNERAMGQGHHNAKTVKEL